MFIFAHCSQMCRYVMCSSKSFYFVSCVFSGLGHFRGDWWIYKRIFGGIALFVMDANNVDRKHSHFGRPTNILAYCWCWARHTLNQICRAQTERERDADNWFFVSLFGFFTSDSCSIDANICEINFKCSFYCKIPIMKVYQLLRIKSRVTGEKCDRHHHLRSAHHHTTHFRRKKCSFKSNAGSTILWSRNNWERREGKRGGQNESDSIRISCTWMNRQSCGNRIRFITNFPGIAWL